MKIRKVARVILGIAIAVGVSLILLIGIGLLPGTIDGVYRGRGLVAQCMCDSVNFTQFRDGKVITYSSNHPPADLTGRYEINSDGSVNIFWSPFKEGETEELFFTAFPRLWFTRFEDPKTGSVQWDRKRRLSGIIKATISKHDIASTFIKDDRTVVKTFFNDALEELRTEMEQLKPKGAESDPRD